MIENREFKIKIKLTPETINQKSKEAASD